MDDSATFRRCCRPAGGRGHGCGDAVEPAVGVQGDAPGVAAGVDMIGLDVPVVAQLVGLRVGSEAMVIVLELSKHSDDMVVRSQERRA